MPTHCATNSVIKKILAEIRYVAGHLKFTQTYFQTDG